MNRMYRHKQTKEIVTLWQILEERKRLNEGLNKIYGEQSKNLDERMNFDLMSEDYLVLYEEIFMKYEVNTLTHKKNSDGSFDYTNVQSSENNVPFFDDLKDAVNYIENKKKTISEGQGYILYVSLVNRLGEVVESKYLFSVDYESVSEYNDRFRKFFDDIENK